MTELFSALIGAALINNLVLGQPVAADALRDARLRALGPAAATTVLLAAPTGWLVEQALRSLLLSHLFLLVCLASLAALAAAVVVAIKRLAPATSREGLWPLLVGNGLGAALLARSAVDFGDALLLGLGGGLGFWLVLRLFADLLARIERCDVPRALQGMPMTLIAAGLMGLAFLGFKGMGAA